MGSSCVRSPTQQQLFLRCCCSPCRRPYCCSPCNGPRAAIIVQPQLFTCPCFPSFFLFIFHSLLSSLLSIFWSLLQSASFSFNFLLLKDLFFFSIFYLSNSLATLFSLGLMSSLSLSLNPTFPHVVVTSLQTWINTRDDAPLTPQLKTLTKRDIERKRGREAGWEWVSLARIERRYWNSSACTWVLFYPRPSISTVLFTSGREA